MATALAGQWVNGPSYTNAPSCSGYSEVPQQCLTLGSTVQSEFNWHTNNSKMGPAIIPEVSTQLLVLSNEVEMDKQLTQLPHLLDAAARLELKCYVL